MKNIYCTLDTETFGGASKPKGIYHLGGFIHDRETNVCGAFNYVIAEHYNEIQKDSYAKKNFERYERMVAEGVATMVATEQEAIDAVNRLCDYYNVRYMMAFNSGFDFTKTACRELLENREFIDIWLMAMQTLTFRKKYQTFCRENGFFSASKKSCSTSAETVYAYLTGNAEYIEEHTALEDSRDEMKIFKACIDSHQKFTKNVHCFDYPDRFRLFPKA